MRSVIFPVALLFTLLFSVSCRKIEKLPPEPSIKFTSFEVFDSTDILGNIDKGGRLKFYFEDGDGDLGLQAPQDNNTDSTNLFLHSSGKPKAYLSGSLIMILLNRHLTEFHIWTDRDRIKYSAAI